MNEKNFSIAWDAPIIPSHSLAGIPLQVRVEDFDLVLENYLVNREKSWYQFEKSPLVYLEKYLDAAGNGGYGFGVVDIDLTNWRLYFDSPSHVGIQRKALAILIREFRVYAIKIWQFESLGSNSMPTHSYQGKLPEGIGLGSCVKDLLPYSALEFDSAEEWFITDPSYGGLEVTGLGADMDLSDEPDQKISALCVISCSSSDLIGQ